MRPTRPARCTAKLPVGLRVSEWNRMAIDFIWARRKRKETLYRRSLDEIRYHRAVFGDEAHEVVVKKLRRCERGSDDAAILRMVERALRPPLKGLFHSLKGAKKPAVSKQNA